MNKTYINKNEQAGKDIDMPGRKVHVPLEITVLKDNGAIGIFPEGTRNRTQEILQPFKFGAVSLAEKTNAYLVPFAITGEYKFRSKNLTVTFGKPFKVGKKTLEEANDKLYNEVLKLLKENKKI